ncbi:MAG: type III secretion T3S chaperone [Parachlamydiaceae bacterium]|nr:type III secretion T3S chaperone [Parachlamydiaceae bacterium]
MHTKSVYPLKQVLEVKEKRVQDAERVVQEKLKILEKEKEKLLEKEKERDTVKTHRIDKLQQLRDILDQGTTSPKIQQMKQYLKVVDEKLVIEEKKVKDQMQLVTQAEKNLEEAKENLKIKRLEVDKLINHQKDWEKEMRKALEILEGREEDELGSVIHASNQRKKIP